MYSSYLARGIAFIYGRYKLLCTLLATKTLDGIGTKSVAHITHFLFHA